MWERASDTVPGWTRSFGRPVDLPDGERIDLVIVAPWPILTAVTLNGRAVPWGTPSAADVAGMVVGRHDVTADLAARNELRLPAAPGPVGEKGADQRRGPLPESVARVWLEIHGSSPSDHP